MNPTLDECNDLLDDLDKLFSYGRDLRLRIHEEHGGMYVDALWRRPVPPSNAEFHVPAEWTLSDWKRGENGLWRARITQVAKPATPRVRFVSEVEKKMFATIREYYRIKEEAAAKGLPPPPLPLGHRRG